MKKVIIAFAALVAAVGCGEGNVSEKNSEQCREFEELVMESRILGDGVKYSVILPRDYYESEKSYPVMYMIHGIGGDCTSFLEYGDVTSTLDSLSATGEISPFIVVTPDIFQTYASDAFDGSYNYQTMMMEEMLPLIDSTYRTNGKRFTLGFSMGGFSAMTLALRHADKFDGFVALSPSVRTDAQYIEEGPQDGWDYQWGRLFGGLGKTGQDRITDYYEECCPMHLLADMPAEELDKLGMFITVGNGETGSLAESNEMLHRILLDRGIDHVWSVSDGGHDFAFWRKVMPDALRFASAKVNGGEYAAKLVGEPARSKISGFDEFDGIRLYMPNTGYVSTRKYPTIYVFGASREQETTIMEYYTAAAERGSATPIAFCFASSEAPAAAVSAAQAQQPRLRQSQRMRSAICFGAASALQADLSEENLFTHVVLVNPSQTLDPVVFAAAVKTQRRYPKFIVAQDAESETYAEGSDIHIAFKNAGLSHKFYAFEKGSGDILRHFPVWLKVLNDKFHD